MHRPTDTRSIAGQLEPWEVEDRLSDADCRFTPARTNSGVTLRPRRFQRLQCRAITRPGNAKADEMARMLLKPWPRVEGVWATGMGMVLCGLHFLNNIN